MSSLVVVGYALRLLQSSVSLKCLLLATLSLICLVALNFNVCVLHYDASLT